MSGLEIIEATADDVALLAQHHQVASAAGAHDLDGHLAVWMPVELAGALRIAGMRRTRVFVAHIDDAAVATGWLGLPLFDNLDAAEIDVVVHPDHRRRGHGSAVLRHLEDLVLTEGRTRLETAPDNPYCFQWGTLVHRAHRGHRLGQAVKVANHRAMQEGADVAGRRVVTWNAEINEHMIGINERLGFVPTVRGAEFQKRLTIAGELSTASIAHQDVSPWRLSRPIRRGTPP